jgi:Ca2+-binding EF-hand superfamily protein
LTISSFFPPGSPQILTLPQFLTQLSTLLSPISPPEELLSAFSAFDDDDSGQVDLVELRDALLHTAPEPGEGGRMLTDREVDRVVNGFTGRRAFGKGSGGRRGDIFRYEDFVGAVSGGGGTAGGDKEK